jgi:hypothetical protein
MPWYGSQHSYFISERSKFQFLIHRVAILLPEGISTLSWLGGLACPGNPESYAGGSLATGRVSQAREVNMGSDQREIPWSSRLGVGREANNLTL